MPNDMKLGALVPAAGLSSRMGSFKPLLPFSDSTVIETAVANVLEVADAAVVVLGFRAEELQTRLYSRFGDKLRFAYNWEYASSDMLTSVRLGADKLRDTDVFFLSPADMPLISGDIYKNLLSAYFDCEVLIPTVCGRGAHPPLISSALIDEIIGYGGEGGLKAIFANRKVKKLELSDRGVLLDLDREEDYKTAVKALEEDAFRQEHQPKNDIINP